jgi:hypothetical protein
MKPVEAVKAFGMNSEEMLRRLELEQQYRFQESQRLMEYREDSIIGDPDSYGYDDELTPEAQAELDRLLSMIEQHKRGYHHALEHMKQMIKGEPCPLTHSGIQRQYE